MLARTRSRVAARARLVPRPRPGRRCCARPPSDDLAAALPALETIVRIPLEGPRARRRGRPRRDRPGRRCWRARSRCRSQSARARADAVAPRRRRRHPLHLRHDRPPEGRDVVAPADAVGRRGAGPRTARSSGSRPLPRHQPLLPLVRLQGRLRRLLPARRDDRAGADLRRRADAGGDRARADHDRPRPADDLPDAAGASAPRRARAGVAAAGGDRLGAGAGRAGRADARAS